MNEQTEAGRSEADFRKLLRRLAAESPVFQRHVLDLVKDLLADGEPLKSSLPASAVDEFIESLPEGEDGPPLSETLVELTEVVGPAAPADVVRLVAAELIHRRLWDEVMEKYPDTLAELKRRLEP